MLDWRWSIDHMQTTKTLSLNSCYSYLDLPGMRASGHYVLVILILFLLSTTYSSFLLESNCQVTAVLSEEPCTRHQPLKTGLFSSSHALFLISNAAYLVTSYTLVVLPDLKSWSPISWLLNANATGPTSRQKQNWRGLDPRVNYYTSDKAKRAQKPVQSVE